MSKVKGSILKLNRLILFTALTATVITFINSLASNYQVQKEQLVSQAIDVNRAYAKKLSDTTEIFLQSSLQQLNYTSKVAANKIDNLAFLQEQTAQLRYQTKSFNSTLLGNKDGIILAGSKEVDALIGRLGLISPRAIEEKAVFITEPFPSSVSGILIILMTVPMFDADNQYAGFVGGSIYLERDNILGNILGEHHYKDGSTIYVIDKSKKILYHNDLSKVGTFADVDLDTVESNEGEGGLIHMESGEDVLIGYSKVPSTDWVIIAQTPVASSLLPLTGIMEEVVLHTTPITFAVFIFVWFFARSISSPLQQLAEKAKLLESPSTIQDIEKINSWYVESHGLKKSILSSMKLIHKQIGQLQRDVTTDPLTGANNRRALKFRLEQYELLETPFSVLALDIDYFKHINDSYGHKVGDDVLKRLVELMVSFSRDSDMVARVGGEEFIFILENCSQEEAYTCAERLRIKISEEEFNVVGHLTVSIGVSSWQKDSISIDHSLNLADEALYEAKGRGRNRSVIIE
ncbi:sensor domain-containing diguanylate cyclase [Marinomonas sp. C2222]|uniref:diguanylate cyclase n=1 Tax=Marinomonas sargassi TaxID=2984494 RepID=A0ABT2YSF3_9GAMM|nr:sensor domain-containing diguanylate cyclase [Marinomonas sargassi]MCV2402805.1 sensor domain-containing diguanylate cyclase [Marinomonas sargassi]